MTCWKCCKLKGVHAVQATPLMWSSSNAKALQNGDYESLLLPHLILFALFVLCSVFEAELPDIPVVKASIAGTRLVGRMCAGEDTKQRRDEI